MKRSSMGSDGSHQWMTVQNSFRVVNITKSKRIIIVFTPKLVTKSTYLPVMYKCILIITEKTMQFNGKDFKGKLIIWCDVFSMEDHSDKSNRWLIVNIFQIVVVDFEVRKTAILLIVLSKGRKLLTFIAVDLVVSLLSKTKQTWKNIRIFTWKMSSLTKMGLKSSWKTIHADLLVAGMIFLVYMFLIF